MKRFFFTLIFFCLIFSSVSGEIEKSHSIIAEEMGETFEEALKAGRLAALKKRADHLFRKYSIRFEIPDDPAPYIIGRRTLKEEWLQDGKVRLNAEYRLNKELDKYFYKEKMRSLSREQGKPQFAIFVYREEGNGENRKFSKSNVDKVISVIKDVMEEYSFIFVNSNWEYTQRAGKQSSYPMLDILKDARDSGRIDYEVREQVKAAIGGSQTIHYLLLAKLSVEKNETSDGWRKNLILNGTIESFLTGQGIELSSFLLQVPVVTKQENDETDSLTVLASEVAHTDLIPDVIREWSEKTQDGDGHIMNFNIFGYKDSAFHQKLREELFDDNPSLNLLDGPDQKTESEYVWHRVEVIGVRRSDLVDPRALGLSLTTEDIHIGLDRNRDLWIAPKKTKKNKKRGWLENDDYKKRFDLVTGN